MSIDTPLPDVSGMHLVNAAVILTVEVPVEDLHGMFKLTDKDQEDYLKLGNVGRIVAIGPSAFTRNLAGADRDTLVGKYAVYNPFTGTQFVYKGTRLFVLDDFQIRMIVDDAADIDNKFRFSTF